MFFSFHIFLGHCSKYHLISEQERKGLANLIDRLMIILLCGTFSKKLIRMFVLQFHQLSFVKIEIFLKNPKFLIENSIYLASRASKLVADFIAYMFRQWQLLGDFGTI